MTCNEAAEYVSALCDGVVIPPSAAEHMGMCPVCQERLRSYIEMGVEMRREACLHFARAKEPTAFKRDRRTMARLWQSGWEAMKIPRLAFALLMGSVVLLASSLVIVNVGARSRENVAVLQLTRGSGVTGCVLQINNDHAKVCGGDQTVNATELRWQIDLLGHKGDQIELGVRSRAYPLGGSVTVPPGDLASEPMQKLWFRLGQTKEVEMAGGVTMSLDGEWMDHVPTWGGLSNVNHDLDPGPNELRMSWPLLLQGKKVIGERFDGMVSMSRTTMGAGIYWPGPGRFIFSTLPLRGAVEGKVDQNDITFDLGGLPYTLIAGAPITRGGKVWILHQPNFTPSRKNPGHFGTVALKSLLLNPGSTGIPN
jgi:hypothetical protein